MRTLILIIPILFFNCINQTGEEVYYYENGNVQFKYQEQDDFLYLESYYETGELMSKGFLKNEEPEKEYYEYYKNGNIKVEGNFKNGLKDGVQKWYHENGEKYKIIGYEAGVEKGIYELYSSSGLVQYKGIKDSLHIGLQYEYYENGNLKRIFEKEGNDTIKYTLYNENGAIEKRRN